jgi:hypothetical protein
MEYPEKVYVALRENDWPDEGEGRTYYHTSEKIEGQAEMHREVEVAVYQYVGKIKLINKTVLAEPDTP